MKRHLKNFFIPHADNNYHPHIFHPKRTAFYAASLIAMKAVVFGFALLVPVQVFMLPDILAEQQAEIVKLTNTLRAAHGQSGLFGNPKLFQSSQSKTNDMAANSYFSHQGPDGRNLQFFLKDAEYQYRVAGENLAMGFTGAAEVIDAWKKSDTHYANLVDGEFEEIGVGISAGEYKGVQTIFIAQHFGTPALRLAAAAPAPAEVAGEKAIREEPVEPAPPASPDTSLAGQETVQAGEPELPGPEPVAYDERASAVSWSVTGGTTQLSAVAVISGDVAAAFVDVAGERMVLAKDSGALHTYRGNIETSQSEKDLFRVITIPALSVTDTEGRTVRYPIHWDRVAVVSPSPVEKYTQSKTLLGGITNLFTVSKGVYAALLLVFGSALLLNIFVEIRRQHPHVIAQSAALVLLIVVFILV